MGQNCKQPCIQLNNPPVESSVFSGILTSQTDPPGINEEAKIKVDFQNHELWNRDDISFKDLFIFFLFMLQAEIRRLQTNNNTVAIHCTSMAHV